MVEFNSDDLAIFSNFERITRVMPTDYLSTETSVIFLVPPPMLGKSIGPKGVNIEKLKALFRKRVIVIADSDSLEVFVRNFFGNITIQDIEIRDVMGESNVIMTVEEKDRGIAIGRDGDRIKAAKSLLKKKFKATIHVRTRRNEI